MQSGSVLHQWGMIARSKGRHCWAKRLLALLSFKLRLGLYSTLFTQFETVHHMVRGSLESLQLASIFGTTRRLSSASGMRRWWRW